MKSKKILVLVLLLVLTSTFARNIIHTANAAPVFVVSLDTHSTSQTDLLVQTTYNPNSTIRVSAIINATGFNTIPGVFSWQFAILYDPTVLVPQADPAGGGGSPACGAYPDCADPTVYLGSQSTGCPVSGGSATGGCNWAGALSSAQGAFIGAVALPGEFIVGFTYFSPHGTVTINQKTILANVAFEIIRKPTAKTALSLSHLSFVDTSGVPLPANVIPGAPATLTPLSSDPKIKFEDATGSGVWSAGDPVAYDSNNDGIRQSTEILISGKPLLTETLTTDPNLKYIDTNGNGVWDPGETIVYDSNGNSVYDPVEPVITGSTAADTVMNDPPHASFTAAQTVNAYTFTFTSTSTDSDGTITGYYWDFGDGTQDLNATGSVILAHDYSSTCAGGCPNGVNFPGPFIVTLRVIDDKLATGSARNSAGVAILNSEPSHTSKTVLADMPPVASFTFTPSSPSPGATVSFDASISNDPDGTIRTYAWNFGDGSTGGNTSSVTHSFALAGTYQVKLNVTDNAGLKSTITVAVPIIHPPPSLALTPPTSVTAGTSATIQLSATASSGSITTIQVNWGDGSPVQNVPATAISATHTYANPGNYTITVTATDDSGSTTQKLTTVMVASSPPSGGFPIIYVIAAVALVAIAAVALLLFRRRRKAPTPTTAPAK
jgi:PKD repeat protein